MKTYKCRTFSSMPENKFTKLLVNGLVVECRAHNLDVAGSTLTWSTTSNLCQPTVCLG